MTKTTKIGIVVVIGLIIIFWYMSKKAPTSSAIAPGTPTPGTPAVPGTGPGSVSTTSVIDSQANTPSMSQLPDSALPDPVSVQEAPIITPVVIPPPTASFVAGQTSADIAANTQYQDSVLTPLPITSTRVSIQTPEQVAASLGQVTPGNTGTGTIIGRTTNGRPTVNMKVQ